MVWLEIQKPGSPALSHHACVPCSDVCLIFIGGWNGKERSSDVFKFNTASEEWIPVTTAGFPPGAGLSSHTACCLESGELVIVGREGSLRTQRRSGNAFIVKGDAKNMKFTYEDMAISVASRSGHTSVILKNKLIIIGGRDDKVVELHKLSTGRRVEQCAAHSMLSASRSSTLQKPPGGRKNHSTVALGPSIFIYGGETFDGRSKEPVSEMYMIDEQNLLSWKSLGKANIGRSGHACFMTSDSVYIHGGIGEGNCVTGGTYILSQRKA